MTHGQPVSRSDGTKCPVCTPFGNSSESRRCPRRGKLTIAVATVIGDSRHTGSRAAHAFHLAQISETQTNSARSKKGPISGTSSTSTRASPPNTLSGSGQLVSRSRASEFRKLVVSGTVPPEQRFSVLRSPVCTSIDVTDASNAPTTVSNRMRGSLRTLRTGLWGRRRRPLFFRRCG